MSTPKKLGRKPLDHKVCAVTVRIRADIAEKFKALAKESGLSQVSFLEKLVTDADITKTP